MRLRVDLNPAGFLFGGFGFNPSVLSKLAIDRHLAVRIRIKSMKLLPLMSRIESVSQNLLYLRFFWLKIYFWSPFLKKNGTPCKGHPIDCECECD